VADHLERPVHHRLVDIYDGTGRQRIPPREHALHGDVDMAHDVLERLVVERRLHERTLPTPCLGVCHKQALARHEREGAVLDRRLAVVAPIGDEHPSHAIRVVHQVAGRPWDGELDDVAVLAPHGVQVGQRIAADRTERLQHLRPDGPGCRGRRPDESTPLPGRTGGHGPILPRLTRRA